MVRVIDAHRFQRQSTYTVPENVIASCLISDDKILLATNQSTIELRSLNFNQPTDEIPTDFEPISWFQTVYEISQMIYCKNGNYVATIERNQSGESSARVYTNWDFIENSLNKNVMARIAGKVSPSYIRTDFVYMDIIELPINGQVEAISCCQLTGNIIIANSRSEIFIYKFQLHQTENKRNSYIDFNELAYWLELSYKPRRIEIAENFIMSMSDKCLNVFKICSKFEFEKSDSEEFVDLNCAQQEFEQCFDGSKENSQNFLINLTSNFEQKTDFIDFRPTVVTNLPVLIKSAKNVSNAVFSLLQLRIPKDRNATKDESTEFFNKFSLKPIYTKMATLEQNKSDLTSKFHQHFIGCGLIVTTAQDGFLYFLTNLNEKSQNRQSLLKVYNFTSPIVDIVLENTLVYAVTISGIEIYTHRLGHNYFNNIYKTPDDLIKIKYFDNPVCLVNMRPFFGIRNILVSNKTLVLLSHASNTASTDSLTNWTLYYLELPDYCDFYKVFENLAISCQLDDKQFMYNYYFHLITEGHIILGIVKEFSFIERDTVPHNIIKMAKLNMEAIGGIDELLIQSNCNLGDFYVLQFNMELYELSSSYYKLGNLSVIDVYNRITAKNFKNQQGLSQVLKIMYKTTKLTTIELDKLFLPTNRLISKTSPISFGEVFLNLLIKESPKDVAIIALDSMIFRQCLKEKIQQFLRENQKKSNEENLCSALYSFDSYNLIEATDCLKHIDEKVLIKILSENYKILFEWSVNAEPMGFSDFCEFLIKKFERIFIQVMLNLMIDSNLIDLSLVIKHLSCYFTSSSGGFTTNLFQTLLEAYFHQFFKFNEQLKIGDKIGLKILMRTYLGAWKDLGIETTVNQPFDDLNKMIKTNKELYSQTDYLDECRALYGGEVIQLEKRFRYLNLMSPFCKYSSNTEDENHQKNQIILFKVQSLLSSSIVPIEIIEEVHAFTKHNFRLSGADSILSLILPIATTVDHLIKSSPQTILGFAIDRFVSDDDWTLLNQKFNKRMQEFEDNNSMEFLYNMGFFKEILDYISTVKPFHKVFKILQNDSIDSNEIYTKYIKKAYKKKKTENLQQMVISNGNQLLDSFGRFKLS